jgi:uncharacterized YceG family protein
VDERPRLNVAGAPPEPPRRRRGLAAVMPIVAGIVIGAAAIAVAVVLLRGGDNGEAANPTPAPATTAAEPALRIVFPEGFTRKEMARRIGAVNRIAAEERGLDTSLVPEEYLALTEEARPPAGFGKQRRSLEGFLFPATYTFTPSTRTEVLVDQQLEAFERAWSRVDLAFAKRKNLTPYDVLIIASMIEGEVQVPKERALVSAVIYNRLRLGMTLGIDATLRYGLDIPPTRAIRQSELEDPNPYNTRIHPGLPPTPIGNPGLASMQAAAHPADVDHLYFVRKADCRSHFFTKSEAEFLAFLERDIRC